MDSDSSDDDTDPLNINAHLHPNNPYVKPYINNSILIYDGKPVVCDNETISIPSQYMSLAIQVEDNSCCIRLCVILDLVINFVYCYSLYGVIYVVFNTVVVMIALCSSYSYNKIELRAYIIYHYFIFILKITLVIYIGYLYYNTNSLTVLHINTEVKPYVIISGQCFMTIIHIPFLFYLHKYYNLLPSILYVPNSIIL